MQRVVFDSPLPEPAGPARTVIDVLREAGRCAYFAGGCVRDLLRGAPPHDYDVATDATPEEVLRLFRAARHVGVQFGVVLVRRERRWIEVATFRTDLAYSDGRRPDAVEFATAEQDAQRRDFTVNGMFLDPAAHAVLDYVGGLGDLERRVVRAIGDPRQRFGEDHLRLLRAVRFAARLGFTIDPQTSAGIEAEAPRLAEIASERVRDELERMLSDPRRAEAIALMKQHGLLRWLWPNARWSGEHLDRVERMLATATTEMSFEAAFALLLADRKLDEVGGICRALTCSNEQRAAVEWLVARQAALDAPTEIPLSDFKQLMAHPSFQHLMQIAPLRHQHLMAEPQRTRDLEARVAEIRPEDAAPRPLIGGHDLARLGVAPGPVYRQVLDAVYREQLEERVSTVQEALTTARALLDAYQQTDD